MKQLSLAACIFIGLFSKSNAQVLTTSDCSTSTFITTNGSYLMSFAGNAGTDETELNAATCFSGAVPSVNVESNSRWFRWNCPVDDTITFVITPLTPTDDLDFVLFKLNDGILNCDNKTVVRCQAAGDFAIPSPCMGKTGLKLGETDLEEAAGCGPSNNNFLAPLIVKAGESYALAILDFSSLFASCTLDFGSVAGFGEILGEGFVPEVRVSPNPTAGGFTVFFEKKRAGETVFSLFDLCGKLVFQQKKWVAPGRQTESFSLENQPSGTYFLKMTEGEKTAVSRVVKN